MPNNSLILSSNQIADAAKGQWKNLSAPITFSGISLDHSSSKPGELYFNLKGRSELYVNKAISKGAIAAVVNTDFQTESFKTPLLIVSDPEQSLKEIARKSRELSSAKTLLVTGSYGKTGFKTQLYHVLKDQLPTHAILNSKNGTISVWKALATIHDTDRVNIVEIAVPSPTRAEKVTFVARPDLCVITWIGHEHLRQHGGTQAHIIANKVKIIKGLPPGGTVIVPKQLDGVYEQLCTDINKLRPDAKILVFGSDAQCHAQLLESNYSNHHWTVKAKILGQTVEFDLPLMENYAPLSAVSVLLAAHCLGGDIVACANQFNSYKNYKSSGNFYELEKNQQRFYLYDQSVRIGIEAFKSTLQLMANIKPSGNGRKIAVFTEFYSLNNAPKELLNMLEFQELFKHSGIDCLYATGKFIEHVDVLPDQKILKAYNPSIENIMQEIIDDIRQDDILFVRGAVDDGEVGLDRFVDTLINHK